MVWMNNCSLNVLNRPTYNCCLTQTDQNSYFLSLIKMALNLIQQNAYRRNNQGMHTFSKGMHKNKQD